MKARVLLAVVALLTLTFGDAIAQTNSESRIAKLEETVRVLEERVVALEIQLRAAATLTANDPAKANWRKLRNGMSGEDVRRLLGSPSRIDNFGNFTIWHYGDPSRAEVKFDKSLKVAGWREP
jgi:outer membrane protein assembly factor BamE (lipoprotein component of BamABCDE complex)